MQPILPRPATAVTYRSEWPNVVSASPTSPSPPPPAATPSPNPPPTSDSLGRCYASTVPPRKEACCRNEQQCRHGRPAVGGLRRKG